MNLKKSLATTLASTALVAGATLAASPPAVAATQNTVNASPSRPIIGERFAVTGELSTGVKRRAILQMKSSGKWKQADSDTTSSSGAYAMSSGTQVDRDYRVVAPATRVDGTAYKRLIGPTKTVRILHQKATATVSDTAPSAGDVIKITGTFSPARKGRKAVVYVVSNGKTVRFPSQVQRSSGRATWTALVEKSDVGTPAYFYVRTVASKGAASISSARVTVVAQP